MLPQDLENLSLRINLDLILLVWAKQRFQWRWSWIETSRNLLHWMINKVIFSLLMWNTHGFHLCVRGVETSDTRRRGVFYHLRPSRFQKITIQQENLARQLQKITIPRSLQWILIQSYNKRKMLVHQLRLLLKRQKVSIPHLKPFTHRHLLLFLQILLSTTLLREAH